MNATPSLISNLTSLTAITEEVAGSQTLIEVLTNPAWILGSLAILAMAYVIVWVMDLSLRILSERRGTSRHILAMLIPVLKILIYIIAVYLVFSPLLHLGLNELAVLSGLLGAGIGFGLKDLFADIVAGFVIIIEKPYQIGDKIELDNNYGEVVDIGLVQTIIVTPDDSRVAIPNYSVFTRSVSSANAGLAEMMVITDLFLSYTGDIAEAVLLLEETVITSRYVFVSGSRPVTILVENHPLYRRLIAKAYVNDLRNEFIFKTDITIRAWQAFEEAGFTPPVLAGYGYPLPKELISR